MTNQDTRHDPVAKRLNAMLAHRINDDARYDSQGRLVTEHAALWAFARDVLALYADDDPNHCGACLSRSAHANDIRDAANRHLGGDNS